MDECVKRFYSHSFFFCWDCCWSSEGTWSAVCGITEYPECFRPALCFPFRSLMLAGNLIVRQKRKYELFPTKIGSITGFIIVLLLKKMASSRTSSPSSSLVTVPPPSLSTRSKTEAHIVYNRRDRRQCSYHVKSYVVILLYFNSNSCQTILHGQEIKNNSHTSSCCCYYNQWMIAARWSPDWDMVGPLNFEFKE